MQAASNIETLSLPYRVSADKSGVASVESPFRNHRSTIGSMTSRGGSLISAIASSVDRATDSSADWMARTKIDCAASVSMSVRSLTEIFLNSGSKPTSKTFRSMSLSRGLVSSAGTIIGAVAINMLVRDTINTHHPTKVQAIRSGQLALAAHLRDQGRNVSRAESPRLIWHVLVGWWASDAIRAWRR